MNPLIAGIINSVPAVVNTVGSLFRNKKNDRLSSSSLLPAFVEDKNDFAKGLELSSKVIVGYGLGGTIVMYALSKDLSQKHNLIILGLGVGLVAITTIAKAFEK